MTIAFDTSAYTQMLDNFKKTVTYTPVTKTTSNISGSETLTDGATSSINIVLFKQENIINQSFEGLFQGADAVVLFKDDITINFNDKITYDGITYRVGANPTTRRLGESVFYNVARLFKLD
jgi:hypothetical protein